MATQYNPLSEESHFSSSSSSVDEGLPVIISLMEWMAVDRQYAAVARPWLVVVGGKWHSSQEWTPWFQALCLFCSHLREPEEGALLIVRKPVEFSNWITSEVLTKFGGSVFEDLATEENESVPAG